MELMYKPDFDRARKYWEAFWNHTIIDRPVVCVNSPLEGATPQPGMSYMSGFEGDYLEALQTYDKWAATRYFGGESIPYCDLSFGPDQFAAFLGSELIMGRDRVTSWIKPYVTDWREVQVKLDTRPGSRWNMMLDFMKTGAQYSKDKFLLSMLDLHSNMDCLNAMRGPQNLCIDLVYDGEEVERVLDDVRQLYQPIYESLYYSGGMQNRGTIGWSPIYCEGRSAVIQCDFIGLIGPKHARRFVIPAIEEEASYLDHCIYHYDGPDALRHLDDILSISAIDVIQWVPGDGRARSPEWMELLKKIQKAGKGLWLFDWQFEDIKQHYKELEPEGLCFQIEASSQSEASEILEWFTQNT